jgi:hypothetical protein
MAGNARFHDKLHRKNHHTNPTTGYLDSAIDPIASREEPFQGDFFLNGALSSNSALFGTAANISGNLSCYNAYVRDVTYTDFISGRNTQTIFADRYIGGNGDNTLTVDFLSGVYINNKLIIASLSGTGIRSVYSDGAGRLTNTSSDATLKENVDPISQGLDVVMQLNPVSFNWKNVDDNGPQREIGFIAQEVQPIIPEVIGVNLEGTLSLDYPKLVAVLTKAIQELNLKLDQKIEEIAKLKLKSENVAS